MNCDDVEELLPFYAAHTLRRSDEDAVQIHLSNCPNHVVQLAQLENASLDEAPTIRARPVLKAKIMHAIREEAGTPDPSAAASPVRFARLAALGLVMLVILGLLAWNLELRASGQSGLLSIEMHGKSGAKGWMFYDEKRDMGVVLVEGLAPLTSNLTYQVWAASPSRVQDCGLLHVTEASMSFARMTGDVSEGDRLFITIEPSGGSQQPSGPPVLTSVPQ